MTPVEPDGHPFLQTVLQGTLKRRQFVIGEHGRVCVRREEKALPRGIEPSFDETGKERLSGDEIPSGKEARGDHPQHGHQGEDGDDDGHEGSVVHYSPLPHLEGSGERLDNLQMRNFSVRLIMTLRSFPR